MHLQVKSILKNTFGFDEFKPLQLEIIESVLDRQDTLVIMPTGGGKSLCYQVPALIFPGLTIVVSPLISLMKDQVEQLADLGVPALFINSSLSAEEYRYNMELVRRNEVKLLYVAPETLLSPRLVDLFNEVRVDCLTIDEAHCISEWGHDFRPEYRQLAGIRSLFPFSVCIALTATATNRVREDIKCTLRLEDCAEFISSFNRENLFLEVVRKVDPLTQTLDFISQFSGDPGIIYCFTRKQVDKVYRLLQQQNLSVKPYHAGLSDAQRKQNQELFIRGDVQIIVATIAFGMGINKPNVRFVLHYDLPKNLESYYQEIGRAGRDGRPADCRLLYSYTDVHKIKHFIRNFKELHREIAQIHLDTLLQFVEADVCRRIPLLRHFGEPVIAETCGMCDNCRTAGEKQVDITIPAQKFLSCVKRTGEIFGSGHVIDVLLGVESQKVHRYGHQKLSTFDIGKDYSRTQWTRLSRQLIQRGYLTQDEQYGSLKLTGKAYELFRSRESLYGILEAEHEPASPDRAQKRSNNGTVLGARTRRKAQAGAPASPQPQNR